MLNKIYRFFYLGKSMLQIKKNIIFQIVLI